MIVTEKLPKRLTVNGQCVFLTTKGLCFPSPHQLAEWSFNVGKKEYDNIPLAIDWYHDIKEYRQLNRELS